MWFGVEDDGIFFGEGFFCLMILVSNMFFCLMSLGVCGGMLRMIIFFGGVGGLMLRNVIFFGGFFCGLMLVFFISGVLVVLFFYFFNRVFIIYDEEIEIVCLVELEREIFNGMEVFEDVFEKFYE